MRLVVIDDSEEKQCRRQKIGPLVGVGAVVFPEDKVAQYRDSIRELRVELSIPPETELKWSPSDGSWLKSPEGNNIRTDLRKRMLQLAIDYEACSLVVIWDRKRVNWDIDLARNEVLKYLYDKISLCLRSFGDIGIVIADEPGGGPSEHKAWLAETLRFTEAGTQWTKPEYIVLPMVTAPSHHVPHLQLADLVSGATVAAVAGNPYALQLLPELSALAHRNSYNCVGGAGLTMWPPELGNLYYHLYGDTEKRRQGMVEYHFPYEGWDYFNDQGLPSLVEGS